MSIWPLMPIGILPIKVITLYILGITEAGTIQTGSIKSSLGIGWLLMNGIGDTLRVSLAADPVEEVRVGFEILKSLELRHRGVNVIACPTCGRVEIDVVRMANELEHRLGHIQTPLTVSVLGCVVNGIGEGKEADIGIAGGQGAGILFKKGKLVKKVPSEELIETLIQEVELMAKEKESEGGDSSSPYSLLRGNQKRSFTPFQFPKKMGTVFPPKKSRFSLLAVNLFS